MALAEYVYCLIREEVVVDAREVPQVRGARTDLAVRHAARRPSVACPRCPPANGPRGRESQKRPRRGIAPVLGIAPEKGVENRTRGRAIENCNRADELDPAELGPVLVVAVNSQCRRRALPKPANTGQLAARSLWLVVDGRPRRGAVDRIGHRPDPRWAAAVDYAKMTDALLLEKRMRPPRQAF